MLILYCIKNSIIKLSYDVLHDNIRLLNWSWYILVLYGSLSKAPKKNWPSMKMQHRNFSQRRHGLEHAPLALKDSYFNPVSATEMESSAVNGSRHKLDTALWISRPFVRRVTAGKNPSEPECNVVTLPSNPWLRPDRQGTIASHCSKKLEEKYPNYLLQQTYSIGNCGSVVLGLFHLRMLVLALL